MLTKTRRAPEVRETLVAEQDPEAAELNELYDTCLKGARMERDAGLRIGEILTKKRGDPKKRWGFNEWVAKNCRFNLKTAQLYMRAHANAYLIGNSPEDWTLTELAQGKKYEAPAEPTIDIKVATTEHPIVRHEISTNDPRPKCPGVEGIGPGCYKWSEAWGEWEQQPAYKEPVTARPKCPGVEGAGPGEYVWCTIEKVWVRQNDPHAKIGGSSQASTAQGIRLIKSARDWIKDYISFCTEEKITAIMETLRRLEHPDRGGSTEITVVLNQYLSERK